MSKILKAKDDKGSKLEIIGTENLKRGEGVQIDNETKYDYGATLETSGVPIMDEGKGKIVSIRRFLFKINPEKIKLIGDADKQKIFNEHAKQIATILWGDGLIPLESVAPRVIMDVKKGFYQIFVACEARRGVVFMEQPKNLTQELAKERAHLDKAKKH